MFCIYANEGERERFCDEWVASGKRLDMGKACVRVKKLEDIPLDVVGRAFKRITAKKFVAAYERSLEAAAVARKSRAAKKTAMEHPRITLTR